MAERYLFIEESEWFDKDRQRIRFDISRDGQTYLCAITQKAVNDCLETRDNREQAFQNLADYREKIVALTGQLVDAELQLDDGVYCLKSSNCKGRLAPRR